MATASGTNLSEEVVSKEEAKRTSLEGAASSPSQEKERLLPEEKHAQAAIASAASVAEEPMEETSDMPYFPSRPFSIFPPDTTAAVTMETTPHQLAPMEEGHFCVLANDIRVKEKPHSQSSITLSSLAARVALCDGGLASFPDPTQLSVACSTEKRGEPGIFSHVSMT